MKDKRKQLFLLAAVVLIWGVIAWQFYSVLSPEETPQVFAKRSVVSPDTATTAPYELLLNYKDPFLKKESRQKQRSGPSPRVVIPLKTEHRSTDPINWAVFKYLGTVENEHTKERVALVSFKSKMLMLKRNEAIEGFRIIRVFNDSLHVGYHDQIKTIYRGQ